MAPNDKTKRIAKNTVFLYIRSFISLVISLYSSRLVLHALGEDDFGIYGVVGGFVSMFTIVSASLSGAISRFLNFAIGKGDTDDLKNTFSQSLNIMIVLALLILLLTETFGLWFLHNKMNITPGRETAAFWCFQFSILSTISGLLVVSFNASIIAHEKMGVYAYIDIAEVTLKLIIALFLTLTKAPIDKLITYAGLWLVVTLLKQTVSRIYAMRLFEEVRLRWYWDKKKFLELFSYAGWSFLGKTSGSFAGQGVNMVINVVFGPAVNAARALSGTVNHTVQIFVNNFTLAVNPQITQSYASGDQRYLRSLLFSGTKFTFFMMYLAALPLVLETPFVLKIWLMEYPAHTVNFIRIALIANTVSCLHVVLAMGIRATGRIMWYQIVFSFFEFMVFILSYLLLHHGFAPEWSYYSGLIMICCQVIAMLVLCKIQLGIPIIEFIKVVVLPLLIVVVVSASIPVFAHLLLPPNWIRFIIVVLLSVVCTCLSCLFIGCTAKERDLLLSMLLKK